MILKKILWLYKNNVQKMVIILKNISVSVWLHYNVNVFQNHIFWFTLNSYSAEGNLKQVIN